MIVLTLTLAVPAVAYFQRFRALQQQGRDAVQQIRQLQLPDSFIPILMPCYGRPEYLQRVLAALQNVTNIDKVRMCEVTKANRSDS